MEKMFYNEFRKNWLMNSGVNDILERIRYYLLVGEEMKENLKEKVDFMNHNLYLFFWAPNNPEVDYRVEDLAKNLELPLECYPIQTEDGYNIQIHRIPGRGPPVLLQHGLMCTSACWLTSGKQSLAYLLSAAGYDVWLGNIRGNRYGLDHSSKSAESEEFWKFTFHHFGTYDIPAIINKITEVTGSIKVNYIGHSMGSTSVLVMASQKPEMVKRLSLVILLAPVAAGQSMTSSIKNMAVYPSYQKKLVDWLGLYYLPPKMPTSAKMVTNRPLFPVFTDVFLRNFVGFIDGYTGDSTDIVNHLPSTVSTYTLLHFSQNFLDRKFYAYDWGSEEENVAQYDQPTPPAYHLSKMESPVVIFSASHDTLSPPTEQQYFATNLPNMKDFREVDMSHLGFLWGKNAMQLVYNPILDILRKNGTH